jgi:hypothetical protein
MRVSTADFRARGGILVKIIRGGPGPKQSHRNINFSGTKIASKQNSPALYNIHI